MNEEEEAFDWEVTGYPQRQQILGKLMPFLKLYESTVDFQNKYQEWMDGPLGAADPDFIEQEVGNIWRGFYKAEKQFKECPAAQKIAVKVIIIVHIFIH